MTSNDINDMMLYGERINIEYKEATNELPKSVWETYSSFANTIGGTLYLVSRNAEIVQLSKDVLKSQELTIPTKS